MNTMEIETLEKDVQNEFPKRQTRVLTEIFSLQQTEYVLSNVERLQLKLIPKKYDTSRLRVAFAEYKENRGDEEANGEERVSVEFRLLQQMQLWRLSLVQRDARITAFQLRRFCKESADLLDHKTVAALACFYRNLTASFEVRSKFDYLITLMFTVAARHNQRIVRVSNADLIEHLRKLNVVWSGLTSEPKNIDDKKRREDAIITFEALTTEINSYSQLEALLKSEFFKRLRRHKQYLGETFYAPEVAAASIVCNVAVGNKFNELVAAENESLQSALISEFGSLSLWQAALEDNPNCSQQILEHLIPNRAIPGALAFAAGAGFEPPKIENASEIFQATSDFAISDENVETRELNDNGFDRVSYENTLGAPGGFESNDANEIDSQMHDDGDDVKSEAVTAQLPKVAPIDKYEEETEFAETTFSTVLAELAKSDPNKNVLSDYLNSSSVARLHNFDFSPFFSEDDEFQNKTDESTTLRKSLHLIFQAEDVCRRKRDAQSSGIAAPEADEIENLIEEMQVLGNDLRLAIGEATGEDKKERSDALLAASNYLLEARLRVGSLNAKSRSRPANLLTSKNDLSAEKAPRQRVKENVRSEVSEPLIRKDKDESAGKNKFVESSFLNINGRLLIALIAVLILAVGVYLANPFGETLAPVSSESVVSIKPEKLRGGNHLTLASVNANEMFGVVKNSWDSLSEEQRRETLKQLLENGSAHNFASLTLLDSKGKIVGRASEKEITTK